MNIHKHKTWARIFLGIVVLFFVLNFVIWRGFTKEMLNAGEYYTPDLVRLAYVTGSTLYRRPGSSLPRRHLASADYTGQHVDVITIGDSFSNLNENGQNAMYQDWLATIHNLTVMNIPPPFEKPADEARTLEVLLNSGYLDRMHPKAVIIECVERHCIDDLGGDLVSLLRKNRKTVDQVMKEPEWVQHPPHVGYVNIGNFKFLTNIILYHLSANAFFSQVYIKDLSEPLFSVPEERRLLFFNEDISSIHKANARTVGRLNRNLNTIARRLKKKGITLYFMPAANKYTIYSDYIINNRFPKSVFFELLRPLPKEYVFVDTKAILSKEVQKGEKDIYFPDDTHWSGKAAKIIAESMHF